MKDILVTVLIVYHIILFFIVGFMVGKYDERFRNNKEKLEKINQQEHQPTRTFEGKPLKYAENGFVKTYCIKSEEEE